MLKRVKMIALRTFLGTGGIILKGTEFFESEQLATQYERHGLAQRIEDVEKKVVPHEIKVVQPELKYLGGGWYELPDGTRVKGKENALRILER